MKKIEPEIKYLDDGRWAQYSDRNKDYKYIISGDSAAGLPNRDGSAASIICLETHEVVANICGQIAPEDFAVELEKAGRYFNDGEIVVERDKYGLIVLHILRDKYPNLYVHSESLTGTYGNSSREFGWDPVRNRNRQVAIDLLKMDIGYFISPKQIEREKAIKIHDFETFLEVKDFVRDRETGKEQAAAGKHDDRISTIYIGNFVWHERMQYYKEKKPKTEETFLDMIRKMQGTTTQTRDLGVREIGF